MSLAGCSFCQIAAGDPAAKVVAEDAAVVAFLDRSPLAKGHVLVATRAHVLSLDELPDELAGPLLAMVRDVSRALQSALGAEGSFTAVNTRISQSVPHLHVHVVPRRKGDGLFSTRMVWMRQRYADGEAEAVALRLREVLASIRERSG